MRQPLVVCLPFLLVACALPDRVQLASRPQPTPVTSTPAPASPESLVVTFNSASAVLAPAGVAVVDHAARLFREGNPIVMTVSGHSDARGAEYPNLLLSARRAEVVKQALVARGIPGTRLQVRALGISEPAITANPSAEENRRVVITWR